MSRVVFLLEERSLRVLLEGLLPRQFPGLPFLCIEHEGRSDLERSIPRKLRAWREPGVRFVIVRDNDGGDCRVLKRKLRRLCREGGRKDALVRIACQELEAWYLGDPDGLEQAYRDHALRPLRTKARFRDPDAVVQPSKVLEELLPAFQKVSGARLMAGVLSRERNTSASFRVFMDGVEREARAMAGRTPRGGG